MKRMNVMLTSLLFLSLTISCGNEKETTNNNTTVVAANTTAKADTADKTSEAVELADKPTYTSGSCEDKVGCVKGFISHGLALTLTPDSAQESKDAEDKPMTLSAIKFNDAQDFGDRFDTAFLKPLIDKEKLSLYDFKIYPTVTRTNFAAGFELYSEGLSAQDDAVKMEAEGNFVLGDIEPYNEVYVRAVKTFRIEITKKASTTDTSEVRAVTCLEIQALIEKQKVEAGKATPIGGIRNFSFYYTEDDSLCSKDIVGSSSQSRDVSASELPATSAGIPE